MRGVAVLLLLWSGLLLVALLFVGGDIQLLPCGRLVGPNPECQALMQAANEEYWRTQMLPRIVIAVGGYVLIVLYGIRTLRRASIERARSV